MACGHAMTNAPQPQHVPGVQIVETVERDGGRKNRSHLHFCVPFTYASSLLSESLQGTDYTALRYIKP